MRPTDTTTLIRARAAITRAVTAPRPRAAGLTLAAVAAALLVIQAGGCVKPRQQPAGPKGVHLYVEGALARESGDREQAVESLETATRANPNLVMARVILGDLYKEDGEFEKAAEQYEALVRLDPYTSSNHYNLGVSYQFLQRLRESLASYRRAIKLDPRDWKAHMNLGLVYMALGESRPAARHARRGAELNPSSSVAQTNLGVVLDAAGNLGEAQSAYQRSLELNAAHTPTALNLVNNLLAQKKAGQAISVLQQVLRTEDSAPIRKRYGDALAMADRPDEAVAEYRAALERDTRYFPAMNAIGAVRVAQYNKGLQLDDAKRDEAVNAWRQSLEINPQQPRVRASLGQWEK